MKSSDTIIRELLYGDRRSAAEFYRHYAPKLLAFIRKRIGNANDSEEILQDTLFAFLESLRDFQGGSSPETYLYAICQHKIIDHYRKKRIAQIVFSKMPSLENIISPLLTPEEAFDSQSVQKKIYKTLHAILPQYKDMITFKYIDGLGVAEIANKLSLTLKSAEMKLFRARKAFVEAFISI